MPEVERRYRTTDETAIVGESLAGLFVVETLLSTPDLFDTYIAIDPSLWWNDEFLVKGAGGTSLPWPAKDKFLYLATSDEPKIAGTTQRLADVLRKAKPARLRLAPRKNAGGGARDDLPPRRAEGVSGGVQAEVRIEGRVFARNRPHAP